MSLNPGYDSFIDILRPTAGRDDVAVVIAIVSVVDVEVARGATATMDDDARRGPPRYAIFPSPVDGCENDLNGDECGGRGENANASAYATIWTRCEMLYTPHVDDMSDNANIRSGGSVIVIIVIALVVM